MKVKIMRHWHHIDAWECTGMYTGDYTEPSDIAKKHYADFFGDISRFESAMRRVVDEWPVSCSQFLSNRNMNRVAWLGQASAFISMGLPRKYRSGFCMLFPDRQRAANMAAESVVRSWVDKNGDGSATEAFGDIKGIHRKIEHYVITWSQRGYPDGIPDFVPDEIARKNLAPSWRHIALALLSNDVALRSLGYSVPASRWYGVLKKIEIEQRDIDQVKESVSRHSKQEMLF